jgi:hypothetical protein
MPLDLIMDPGFHINDYTYALLHKLIEDENYYNAIKANREDGHAVYLDNSCYELGASLDNRLLANWVFRLKPTLFMLPDVLGNKDETIKRSTEFLEQYGDDLLDTSMAVIQGSTFDEMVECYRYFRDYRFWHGGSIRYIAIPFVFSWVDKVVHQQAAERIRLLRHLDHYKIVDLNRWHHLLGTWQAFEFGLYHDYKWIKSIDTSNPVMAAIDGVRYEEHGLSTKPLSTFDKTYNMKKSDIDMDLLHYNCNVFRSIVNGGSADV